MKREKLKEILLKANEENLDFTYDEEGILQLYDLFAKIDEIDIETLSKAKEQIKKVIKIFKTFENNLFLQIEADEFPPALQSFFKKIDKVFDIYISEVEGIEWQLKQLEKMILSMKKVTSEE